MPHGAVGQLVFINLELDVWKSTSCWLFEVEATRPHTGDTSQAPIHAYVQGSLFTLDTKYLRNLSAVTSALVSLLARRTQPILDVMASNAGDPAKDAIRQIDSKSWLIGGQTHLVRTNEPSDRRLCVVWNDDQDAFFSLLKAEATPDSPSASTIPTVQLPTDGPLLSTERLPVLCQGVG